MRFSTLLLAGCLLAGASLRASDPADTAAARARVEGIRGSSCAVSPAGEVTEISIPDGSGITAADVAVFARLDGLTKLQILNCRGFDDGMVASLAGLGRLNSLAITNSGIGDGAVATIAASFPDLVELDLSSNTNLTGAAMKSIASLSRLERLTLVQTRFNDLNFRRLARLPGLRAVDLRGTMEAGDMTLGVLGGLPALRSLKHRSTIVTDDGVAALAACGTLDTLLAQDFAITDASGRHLAAMANLASLEIFRCQGFGSEGLLALAPLRKLSRLALRDLPEVGDAGLAVLGDLAGLRRLSLHELASVGDAGLARLAAAKGLESLDVWAVPGMTDASVGVVAGLPALRELSLRETGCSEAALDRLAAMPTLESLTFRNADVSPGTAARIRAAKAWRKLDLGE